MINGGGLGKGGYFRKDGIDLGQLIAEAISFYDLSRTDRK